MKTSKAMVLVDKERFEMREFPLPEIGDDDALMRMEASGMCGTDLDYYYGYKRPGPGQPKEFQYPFIPGHEPVGVIEKIGPKASARWKVKAGDRVTASYFTCGKCEACKSGRQESCQEPVAGIGKCAVAVPPALWGSYSQYMYIAPMADVARFNKPLPAHVAALFNPLAGAWAWAVERSGLKPGQTIAIIGPGQRGLAAIIAAKDHGASFVAMVGRGRNPYKLDLARDLGADMVVNQDKEDPVAAVRKATGAGVDVAVDLTPDPTSFPQALTLLKRGGVMVEAGLKRGGTIERWCPDIVQHNNLTVVGAYGQSKRAKFEGIRLVESGKYPVERLVTHTFPLEKTAEALETLAGKYPERKAMNVVLTIK